MASQAIREYHYLMDIRGYLHLLEGDSWLHMSSTHASSKFNFVTALKDQAFLQFFLRNLKRNTDSHDPYTKRIKYASYCGKEKNYLHLQDEHSALTFGDWQVTPSNDRQLRLGHSNLWQPFDPSALLICALTGRLYHPICEHKYLSKTHEIGLMHPAIALSLSNHLTVDQDKYHLQWLGKRYDLSTI